MTDRLQALIELRDAVKAGRWRASYDLFGDEMHKQAFLANNGSLDAAKALHEAVLGCQWSWNLYDEGQASVARGGSAEDGEYFGRFSETPARAWLLAVLSALIAQERTQ